MLASRVKEESLKTLGFHQLKISFPPLNTSPACSEDYLLLIEANLPTAPNQVVVGDITYLPNEELGYDKWLYLATWLDLKSRRIVGWNLDRHMEFAA